MEEYIEIEDPREIRRINRILARKLRSALVTTKTRTIGYPRGSFESRVHFMSATGSDILYWSDRFSGNKSVGFNFFGHGTPNASTSLNIDVQFNLPLATFSRKR